MLRQLRRRALAAPLKRSLTFLFSALVCYYFFGNIIMVAMNGRRTFSVPHNFHPPPPGPNQSSTPSHPEPTPRVWKREEPASVRSSTLKVVQAGVPSIAQSKLKEKPSFFTPLGPVIIPGAANSENDTNRTNPDPIDLSVGSRNENEDLNRNFSWWSEESSNISNLPVCPEKSPLLRGKLDQAVLLIPLLKEQDVSKAWDQIRPGGEWKPTHCIPRHKVGIILPFRDRQSHLNRLLDFLFPILQRQLLDFRIIVTEQYGQDLFNKGRIMNAAFTVAEAMGVDCVIFHDVDMFPQDDRIDYGCPTTPRHLGAYVNSLGYDLWYNNLVGGALTMRTDHYHQVNGYSNLYWGWGGEDDDMGKRILANNFAIDRLDKTYARFTMLKHPKRKRTTPALIYKLLGTAEKRYQSDGLRQKLWKIVKIERRPVYYHVFVDVGPAPKEWKKGA